MIPLPAQGTLLLPFRESAHSSATPLRVGIVTGDGLCPPWIKTLVSFLDQIPGLETRVLTAPGVSNEPKPAWLTDRLYSMSRAKFDPFEAPASNSSEPVAEAVESYEASDCDLVIWLAPGHDLKTGFRAWAKHGVFTVRLGDQTRKVPFWNEVSNNSVTSIVNIYWHDESFAQGREVRRLETSTAPGLFVTLNAEQPLTGAIRMLAGLCLLIRDDPERFLEQMRRVPPEPVEEHSRPSYPSNFEAARFAAAKMMRSAYRRFTKRGTRLLWFVAMRPNAGASITDPARSDLTGFREVPMPAGIEQMADPFLWEAEGRQYLLFEAVRTGQSRGRLACLEVLPDGSFSELQEVLERPYHLSYPCVFQGSNDLFLLPETSEANRIDVYRFTHFPDKVELIASPVEGVRLVDTTPVFLDGLWYFFTTTSEPFMETILFFADRPEGPWKLHPCNPVSASVRSCRSAGQLFWKDGRLFRPVQDCSVSYGYAIAVNEVTRLTKNEFEERPVNHILPSWQPGLCGTHTWNENAALQVIDGIREVR